MGVITFFGQLMYPATHFGMLNEEVIIAPGVVQSRILPFYASSASYVNGGLTFTYPTNFFNEAPNVCISIQSSSFVNSVLSARISSNSATSTTVVVNAGTLLSLGEILTGTATVHIWATGGTDQ